MSVATIRHENVSFRGYFESAYTVFGVLHVMWGAWFMYDFELGCDRHIDGRWLVH